MAYNDTVLVLGVGATRGGDFEVVMDDISASSPLDANFFHTSAVKRVFLPDKYPALQFYHSQRQPQEYGLEDLWARVDLYLKLCISGVINEESSYHSASALMAIKADHDESYRLKMETENRRWRVPSMAAWELIDLVGTVLGKVVAPKDRQASPLYQLVQRFIDEDRLAGVISFNYDTSLEQLFPETFYYPLLPKHSVLQTRPLFKLHGSLNWQYDSRYTTSPIRPTEPYTI